MPEVIINGPAGRLEGRYHIGIGARPPLALVLHPDPQAGGTMNNKVVYALFHSFAHLGFSVLRFNFRGVGRSEGAHDNGEGELVDAAAALDWLQATHEDSRTVWVSGFSFGAWLAFHLLMRRPELGGFVSVAPPVDRYDFNFLAPCPSSGIVLQGDQDTIVPEASVAKLATEMEVQKNVSIAYQMIPGADHFFEGRLDVLAQSVVRYVSSRVRTPV
ncbi:MAG: alpha/beta hydrolase [Rhodospirillales bacterium]|nr:alpha/beta hydrolase [Rhodospirillales bacterium]